MPELHDRVERVSRDELIPYSNNPKEHPEEQVNKIASSIKNYGWDQPIVVDGDGEIIKGHGRLQAAEKLGLDEVPVIWREDLSDAEAKAARIADNKAGESTWDIDLLGLEFELLDDRDFDVELTAFDEDEIEAFGIDGGNSQPDAREEWKDSGLAEYENEDKNAKYSFKINFASKDDLEAFGELVESTVTEDTTSIWYPKQEHRDVKDMAWQNEF